MSLDLDRRAPIDLYVDAPPDHVAVLLVNQQVPWAGDVRGTFTASVSGTSFELAGGSRTPIAGLIARGRGELVEEGSGTRVTGEVWLPAEARTAGRTLTLRLLAGSVGFAGVLWLGGAPASLFAIFLPFLAFLTLFNSASAVAHAVELREALAAGLGERLGADRASLRTADGSPIHAAPATTTTTASARPALRATNP